MKQKLKEIKIKHKCYDDIEGNIIVGWKCYKCKKRLNWFEVFRLGMKGKYDDE